MKPSAAESITGSCTVLAKKTALMAQFGLIPWVRRQPGQEAQAQVLRRRERLQQRIALPQPFSKNVGVSSALKREAAPATKSPISDWRRTVQTTTSAEQQATPNKNASRESRESLLSREAPAPSLPLPQHSAKESTKAHVVTSRDLPPLSLLYTELVSGVWILAECDEWDQGSANMFQQLVRASRKLATDTDALGSHLEWFHWPMRLPAGLINHEENLRHALRGWMKGRRRTNAVWISLGRRFVDLMVPEPLPRGKRYTGRSGMDVIWFDSLQAMQLDASAKRALWQFLQDLLKSR